MAGIKDWAGGDAKGPKELVYRVTEAELEDWETDSRAREAIVQKAIKQARMSAHKFTGVAINDPHGRTLERRSV